MINGQLYRDMVISAANSIENEKEAINALNVFPVPDGDTGLNMSLTMQAAKTAMLNNSEDLAKCSDTVAGALLRGGRGNSGVILSLFFRGVSKGLKGLTEAGPVEMAKAFRGGVDSAYKAVRHPTEGTILTVMRVCTAAGEEYAAGEDTNVTDFFNTVLKAAEEILAQTPEMLPVLKQAKVVDAGGQGFVTILKGMCSVINGVGIIDPINDNGVKAAADFGSFNTEDIKFQYCTECIIDLNKDVTDADIEAYETVVMDAGDSNVFVVDRDSNIIKVHVHTNDPGKVLSAAVKCGQFFTVKVENMKLQHSEIVEEKPAVVDYKKAPEKKYGFVSVSAGEGIEAVFKDLGVDVVVSGGQTMNPSTDDIIKAIEMTPAEVVYVLPNNKNIYMAAQQAEKIVKDKQVIVLRTVSIPQGVSAMLAFDPEGEVDVNTEAMKAARDSVISANLTFAARDSVFDGAEIHEGQILGLVEGKVKYICNTKEDCMDSVSADFADASYITVFYGEDVSEDEAEQMKTHMEEKMPDKEIVLINGGQPVYYYIISAE
ncbi:MAG: DAK2 domain-containing protein [Ruminococcus sp.]|nr:DAK2 domain-containing protein [Ruminococcus sp.]